MSVKQGLLALLSEEPKYGAQLRSEFESRTGGTWPLNIGQVYTTLTRLERDGLVEQDGPADDEGRIRYRLTDAGREAVAQWWAAPVDRSDTPRDELVIKLALAVTAPGVDVQEVAQRQRTATLSHLRDLTRLKQGVLDTLPEEGGGDTSRADLAWLLVLENLIFGAEAEVRWLDHVESRLAREASRSRSAAPATRPADADTPRPARPTLPAHPARPAAPDLAPADRH